MRQTIIALFISVFTISLSAQEEEYFMTGLLPDDGTYDKLPRKAELLTRDYKILPSSYSLEKYCPDPGHQYSYGTCTTWATAYAARTIAEAVKYGWTDKDTINKEAFSPLFVYSQIKDGKDVDCQNGSAIYQALDFMKKNGVAKYSDCDVLCANNRDIDVSLKESARSYKIDNYFPLHHKHTGKNIVPVIKKAISENNPVVIAMHLPMSFNSAKGTWDGVDVDPNKHGYHAMCTVGYDDNKDGGAFLVMNSWGKRWGNNGFIWVTYSDFEKYVDQAYEIYVRRDGTPDPTPTPMPEPMPTPIPNPNPEPITDKLYCFSGEIELYLSTSEKMPVNIQRREITNRRHRFNLNNYLPFKTDKDTILYYNTAEMYLSGTRYRIYISNNEPAYLYVIGSDLQNNVSKVFPFADNISAALTYKSNNIAIPDENHYIEFDDTAGTDYMCVLYSQYELDINSIITSVKEAQGSFYEKIYNTIGDKLVSYKDVKYIINSIGFSAKSPRTVVPIFVELTHGK